MPFARKLRSTFKKFRKQIFAVSALVLGVGLITLLV